MTTDQLPLLANTVESKLFDILHNHVEVVIEAAKTSIELFLSLHEDPNVTPNALVDHLKWQDMSDAECSRGRSTLSFLCSYLSH